MCKEILGEGVFQCLLSAESHAPSNIIRLFSIEYLEHRTKMPRRPKEASFRNDTSRPYPAKVVLIVIV